MILQALTAYYEAMLANGAISAPGWDDSFKVSFMLEVGNDGTLRDVIDCRELVPKGKKQELSPQKMRVPAHVRRASGVAANFLCDNSSYMLGADDKGKPQRSRECFAACAALHHKLLDNVDNPAARAVLAFFDTWQPELAPEHPLLQPIWNDIVNNANFVFVYNYDGKRLSVTDDSDFRHAWQQHYQDEDPDALRAQCLVTGEVAPVLQTHPLLKGVRDAQSAGASIVSFNAPAFCSFGHEQGSNAPVSKYAAFAYTTALNTLLADSAHRRYLGDTTVVCWAENARTAAADLGIYALFDAPAESGLQEEDIGKALSLLARGECCDWLGDTLQPDQHIYFLGLAPNSARISVRFFLCDSLGSFAEHIREHEQALEIIRPSYDERTRLSVWALARETVNLKERNPSPTPQLAGDLLRAVLTGGRYPATLINGVTLRIRAEREITRGRAAIIKAYYTRNHDDRCPEEVLKVELNEQSNYAPYVLGRLFSVLEAIQDAANPGINTTIKDRYFNSACATPSVAFPTLIKLAQKHLQKLGDGSRCYYDRQLTSLMCKLDASFPTRLTLPEQGAFELGYYHQTQKRYEKRNKED